MNDYFSCACNNLYFTTTSYSTMDNFSLRNMSSYNTRYKDIEATNEWLINGT